MKKLELELKKVNKVKKIIKTLLKRDSNTGVFLRNL